MTTSPLFLAAAFPAPSYAAAICGPCQGGHHVIHRRAFDGSPYCICCTIYALESRRRGEVA